MLKNTHAGSGDLCTVLWRRDASRTLVLRAGPPDSLAPADFVPKTWYSPTLPPNYLPTTPTAVGAFFSGKPGTSDWYQVVKLRARRGEISAFFGTASLHLDPIEGNL